MKELENLVKSVVYGGIGAAATIVEKGGDIARALVEKGQETVRANQDTVDQIKETAEDLKRRVQEFCERFMNDDVIDASCLTPEQRAAVREQLDAQDELDRQAAEACQYDAAPTMDMPMEEPSVEIPEVADPQVKSVPIIEFPPEDVADQAEPATDDNVPVFEPEQPTYSADDDVK